MGESRPLGAMAVVVVVLVVVVGCDMFEAVAHGLC